MFRLLYCWLLRLHPPRFRRRFAEEMLSIFDHVEEGPAAAKFVAGGFVSLVRQWMFRSEYWEERPIEQVQLSSDGAPVFYSVANFKPRASALIIGGVLTLGLFCATLLDTALVDVNHDWAETVFMGRGEPLWSYAGAYMTDPPNQFAVLITINNEHLAIEIPEEPSVELVPTNRSRFVFSDANQSWVEFVKRDGGIAYELNIYRGGRHFIAQPAQADSPDTTNATEAGWTPR
jgi:hypothetical protein